LGSALQLITKYYRFASPTLTGLWRVQTENQAWQLAFRGGQLVDFESAAGTSDFADFLLDVGAIGSANHTLLRAVTTRGSELMRMIAEVVGGSAALLRLRRQHALHRIGALLCKDDTSDSFSATPVDVQGTLELDALAIPYLALRLQPPERLQGALAGWQGRKVRLQRNPDIPVAGLCLDREALNVAREFTQPRDVAEVIAQHSAGAEALVSQAAALTLLGCQMLVETDEVAAAPAPAPQPPLAQPPRISPSAMNRKVPSLGVTRIPGGRELTDENQPPPTLPMDPTAPDDTGQFETMATGTAPPVSDTGEIFEEPKVPSVDEFLDTIDRRLITDAEASLDQMNEPEHRIAVLRDYLNANSPRHGDPGGAMSDALAGLQKFTTEHPDDHLGPLLLSRLYENADNAALAQVFGSQAKRLAPEAPEVANWKHCK